MGVNSIGAYSYYKYRQARDAAWQCLIDTSACSLPVKTLKIAAFFGIKVIRNSDADLLEPSEYGCSIVDENGNWTIVYEDSDTPGRIRFTVAHELGHILLGHEIESGFGHYRRIVRNKPMTETQADEFAARILAPACVLWALNITSAAGIERVCGISHQAALYRARRMRVLTERGKFLTSPLERKVFEAFQPWIEQQKNRPV